MFRRMLMPAMAIAAMLGITLIVLPAGAIGSDRAIRSRTSFDRYAFGGDTIISSLAVRSRKHVPVVFDDPNKFMQEKFYEERDILGSVEGEGKFDNASRRFLLDTARSAKDASAARPIRWRASAAQQRR